MAVLRSRWPRSQCHIRFAELLADLVQHPDPEDGSKDADLREVILPASDLER